MATYNLVATTDNLPDSCLGGCVYKKEGDTNPGNNYCFKEGTMDTYCSGDDCPGGGNVEKWIEKYFQKECSMTVNSVLQVSVSRRYSYNYCGGNPQIMNATVEVFKNADCEGPPLKSAETEGSYSQRAYFFLSVQKATPWSVRASAKGYQTQCSTIGVLVPFQNNWQYMYLQPKETESSIIPTASLNFTFDINTEILSEVMIQGNPSRCFPFYNKRNSLTKKEGGKSFKKKGKKEWKKSKKGVAKKIMKKSVNQDYEFFFRNPAKRSWGSGSGSGSGPGFGNYKCSPNCMYSSSNTNPSFTSCPCKGVIGGGMNYSSISMPSAAIPTGMATLTGSLYWYNDTSVNPNYYPPTKLFTLYTRFMRRGDDSVKVCKSNLTVSFINGPLKIEKKVPCFAPKIAPTPTYPPYPGGYGSGSGFPGSGGMGSGVMPSGFPTGFPGAPSGFPTGFPPVPSSMPPAPSPIGGLPSGFPTGSLPWPTTYPQWLTTPNYNDMWSEEEGVLIYGGDRHWMIGCVSEQNLDKPLIFNVDFFTTKEPRETPEFCGCLLNNLITDPTVDQIKDCYEKALKGGPAPYWRNQNSRGRKAKKGKGKKKSGKSNKRPNEKQAWKQNLRKYLKKQKAKNQGFRMKREIIENEPFARENEIFFEDPLDEFEKFEEQEDDEFGEYDNYEADALDEDEEIDDDDEEYDDYDEYSISSDW